MTQRKVLHHRVYSVRRLQPPIELPHLETFPGAACLPTHRAARLLSGSPPGLLAVAASGSQAFGRLNPPCRCREKLLDVSRMSDKRYPLLV
jgi:hypothetical protein